MKINRRQYLYGMSTVVSFFGRFSLNGQAAHPAAAANKIIPQGVIDWHTHWVSPTELKILKQRTAAPRLMEENGARFLLGADTATGPGTRLQLESRHVDLESRIPYLDKNGIERQIISYTIPVGYDATIPLEELKPLLKGFNDDLSVITRKHPTRFSGLAALSTEDVHWSASELERTHSEYGFLGGSLPLNAFATLEGARKLAPIFEKAQQLKSHLLIHRGAASPSIPGQPTFQPPSDTTYARATLITNTQLAAGAITLGLTDFLDAYPDVTVQIIMLGGSIPYVLEQIQLGVMRSSQAAPNEKVIDPVERFRRVYFDPGPYSVCQRAVELTTEAFGADRVLFGSDYGPMPAVEPALEKIGGSERLSAKDKELIFHGNARELFRKKGLAVS